MAVRDAVGDGSAAKFVGLGARGVVGEAGLLIDVDVPHAGWFIPRAGEDALAVVEDAHGGSIECNGITSIAKAADGQERTMLEGWDDVGAACGRAKGRKVQVGFVGRSHDLAIRVGDPNWVGRCAFVDDGAINANAGAGGAGIGYERFCCYLGRSRWHIGGTRTGT